MIKIYFALGAKAIEDYLTDERNRKEIEGQLGKRYRIVGQSVYREAVLTGVMETRPDVLVIREGLNGSISLSELFRQLKLNCPETRIVFLAKDRAPGDAFLASLVNLGIYDLIIGKRLSLGEILQSIANPATLASVVQYVPKVTVDERTNKTLYEAPTIIEVPTPNQKRTESVPSTTQKPLPVESAPTPETPPKIAEVKDVQPLRKTKVPLMPLPGQNSPTESERQPATQQMPATHVQKAKPEKPVTPPLPEKKELFFIDEEPALVIEDGVMELTLDEEMIDLEPSLEPDVIEPPVLTQPEPIAQKPKLKQSSAPKPKAPIDQKLKPQQQPVQQQKQKPVQQQKQVPVNKTKADTATESGVIGRFFQAGKKETAARRLPTQVVAFIGARGGVGNSQTAFTTAFKLAETGHKVLYMDLHEWQSSIDSIFQLGYADVGIDTAVQSLAKEEYGRIERSISNITKILPVTPREHSLYKTYARFPKNLDFMCFSQAYMETQSTTIDTTAFKDLLLYLLMHYGYDAIIIDAYSNVHSKLTEVALVYSSKIFFTLTQDYATLGSHFSQIRYLDKKKIQFRDKCGYVLVKYENSILDAKTVQELLSETLRMTGFHLLTIPNISRDCINANYEGVPLLWHCKGNREFQRSLVALTAAFATE